MEEELEIELGRLLRQKGLKLAVAESCTGGLVANRLTDVPGSSEYFLGGFVAYAYEAKVDSLGVSWDMPSRPRRRAGPRTTPPCGSSAP